MPEKLYTDRQLDYLAWQAERLSASKYQELAEHLLSKDHSFQFVIDDDSCVLQCVAGEHIGYVETASPESFWDVPFSQDENNELHRYRREPGIVASLAKHFAFGSHIWGESINEFDQDCETCGIGFGRVSWHGSGEVFGAP